jgi:hypothetical protein
MEEFFRFIQQSGRDQNRLIQEVRAIHNNVVPPTPIREQSNKAPTGHTISGVNAFREDGVVS